MFEVESEEVSLEMGSLRHSFIQARMPMFDQVLDIRLPLHKIFRTG